MGSRLHFKLGKLLREQRIEQALLAEGGFTYALCRQSSGALVNEGDLAFANGRGMICFPSLKALLSVTRLTDLPNIRLLDFIQAEKHRVKDLARLLEATWLPCQKLHPLKALAAQI